MNIIQVEQARYKNTEDTEVQDLWMYNRIVMSSLRKGDNHESGISSVK